MAAFHNRVARRDSRSPEVQNLVKTFKAIIEREKGQTIKVENRWAVTRTIHKSYKNLVNRRAEKINNRTANNTRDTLRTMLDEVNDQGPHTTPSQALQHDTERQGKIERGTVNQPSPNSTFASVEAAKKTGGKIPGDHFVPLNPLPQPTIKITASSSESESTTQEDSIFYSLDQPNQPRHKSHVTRIKSTADDPSDYSES